MKGEKTQGVRIRPIQPVAKKEKPFFTEANFENAKKANASVELIKERYQMTTEIESKYLSYVGAKE